MARSDCLGTQVLTEFGLSGGRSQHICAPIDTAHDGARPTAQRGSAEPVIPNGVLKQPVCNLAPARLRGPRKRRQPPHHPALVIAATRTAPGAST